MRWDDKEDSHWRRSVANELTDITFYHPQEGYFDHGGDLVHGAVSEDMEAIAHADGLVAYFSEIPQVGTMVEVVHAAQTETPTLVLLDQEFVYNGYFDDRSNEEYLNSENPGIKVTREIAPIDPVSVRGSASDHWFLINYLLGDDPDASQRTIPSWISEWDGIPQATVMAVASQNAIRTAVESWINKEF
jgi:hypothetical protein